MFKQVTTTEKLEPLSFETRTSLDSRVQALQERVNFLTDTLRFSGLLVREGPSNPGAMVKALLHSKIPHRFFVIQVPDDVFENWDPTRDQILIRRGER